MPTAKQPTEAEQHRDFIYDLLDDHARELSRDAQRRADPIHELTIIAHIEDILANWTIELKRRSE